MTDLALGDEVYVGLFLCSHNPDVVEKAVFRNVRFVRPARDGFVPYRDYIGSRLEILDVRTGAEPRRPRLGRALRGAELDARRRRPHLQHQRAGGAGTALSLRPRHPARSSLVDTGFAVRNNNDHVLSFDGTMLGISDQSAPDGQSAVYTLPARGGTPRRITPLAPSYFHGWSPDGKHARLHRREERRVRHLHDPRRRQRRRRSRLTDWKGLDDGPEYTPDGRFIYFNSTRSGTMQIWRMKPDGSDPEQVTSDELNNWFPHVVPGRHSRSSFLSFGKDVDPVGPPVLQAGLHPPDADRGRRRASRSRTCTAGRARINVPSWSPDGTMLAFVSNTDME